MPYDPTPVGADADASGHRDTLTVQIEGTRDEGDVVLTLTRPAGGRVHVREFPAHAPPRAYDEDASVVLTRVEGAARARRRVGVELALVRAWLAGRA